MNELVKRSASGILYVALISFATIYSFTAISLLMGIFLFIACRELSKILKMSDTDTGIFSIVSVFTYFLLLIPVYIPSEEYYFVPFAIVSAIIVILAGMKKYDMVFGWIYLCFPLALISFFPVVPDFQFVEGTWKYNEMFNTDIILIFFVLMWTYDVMAYVCGRLFGRNKLAPVISPGKTWEGVFGGLSFTIMAGLIIAVQYELSEWLILPMCIIIVVFGTMGDLLESMLKRQSGLKDSGTLIPGHGGLLDRIDGILMAIPAVVSFLYLYNYLV